MHELFRPVVQQVIGHLSDLIELFLNIFGGRLTANSKLTDIIVLFQIKIVLPDLFVSNHLVG